MRKATGHSRRLDWPLCVHTGSDRSGSPFAEGLRRFAGEVPRHTWRVVRLVDGLVFAAAVVIVVAITLAFS